MWANRSLCSYSDFNLAYVAKFQYKTGYAKKKRYGNPQHIFFTWYIFCTKELSSLRILSSLHKVAYFYDVGNTYAIDQKINHLHNDRVANMWRNNVPSVCGRG
jgi:hypothetical protein